MRRVEARTWGGGGRGTLPALTSLTPRCAFRLSSRDPSSGPPGSEEPRQRRPATRSCRRLGGLDTRVFLDGKRARRSVRVGSG